MIPPVTPDANSSEGQMELRYEDVTQDGHLRTVVMPNAMGKAFWQSVSRQYLSAVIAKGIYPILNNLRCEVGAGPIGLRAGLSILAHYDLAHIASGDEVQRIVLRVWATMRAPRAAIHGPPPPGAGEIIDVGRAYAEHVFTRLFAARGKRRVLELEAPNLPRIPPTRIERVTVDDLVALPPDAAWSSDWERDSAPVVFGVDHTDANQHVNSLVYPTLFRDAALRLWDRADLASAVRIERDETLFRKPSFAGERLAVEGRAFTRPGTIGAVLRLIDPLAESACRTATRVEASLPAQ